MTTSSVTLFLFICAFSLTTLNAQAQQTAPQTAKRWELHLKFGSQSYLNELDPDPGSASLGGFLVGYHFSDRSMIGLHSASLRVQIQYVDGTTEEEYVNSFLLIYRYAFRVQKPFQPYLEAGVGTADPIIGYDTGSKPAFTLALGALWRFHDKWAASLESRGVSWSQDNASDLGELLLGVEGEPVTVSSNEFTIGVGYLF